MRECRKGAVGGLKVRQELTWRRRVRPWQESVCILRGNMGSEYPGSGKSRAATEGRWSGGKRDVWSI